MQEIKQIIIERIQSIFDLQTTAQASEPDSLSTERKYERMIGQKKSEKIRNIRENQILLSLNAVNLEHNKKVQELYQLTQSICATYDPQFCKFKEKMTVSMKENLRKIYCDFFNEHGFKHKTKQVHAALEKPFNAISPAMFLGWLSEWSKKIYCEMLQKQIQASFEDKEKRGKQVKVQSVTLVIEKKIAHEVEAAPDLSALMVNGRANIYGFFIDELSTYYKFIGLEGVDHSYLKTIRKKNKKEDFLKPTVLNKAVETMTDLPGNREIHQIMKRYKTSFSQKFPQAKLQTNPKSNLSKKTVFISPEKKKRNITDEGEGLINASKLLSSKLSEFEFYKPYPMEMKAKKIKILGGKTRKSHFQLPQIRKNSYPIPNQMNLSYLPSLETENNILFDKMSSSSLENRRVDKSTTKHQAVSKKMDDLDNAEEFTYAGKLDSPTKLKKAHSNHHDFESQYDDRRLKASKNFNVADLKLVNRIPSIKAKFHYPLKRAAF